MPVVRGIANVVSWPLYQLNRGLNMGACIVCEINKPV